jgi:uncharacterized protein (DUF736 family)
MSKEYDNTNSGTIFDNDRKEKDTHPDFTGTLNVEGKDYWISAWKKTSKGGKRFISLAVKPKDGAGKPAAKKADDSDLDDIPW